MSAAFQVRRPFPSQRHASSFSRSSGSFRQPEADKPINMKRKRHSNSQSAENFRKFKDQHRNPHAKSHSHSHSRSDFHPSSSSSSSSKPAKKPRVDPLFQSADSDSDSASDSDSDSDEKSAASDSESHSSRVMDSEVDERMRRRKQLLEMSLQEDSSAEEDTSPAAQLKKMQADKKKKKQEVKHQDEDDEEDDQDEENEDSAPEESGVGYESSGGDSNGSGAHSKSGSQRSRNGPLEMSAKVPVSRHMNVIQAKTYKPLDPRFNTMAGDFKEGSFRNQYKFIEQYQKDELQHLKGSVKKLKHQDPEAADQVLDYVKRQESSMKQQEQRDRERSMLNQWKKQEKKMEAQGKKPYYLKKSAVKQMKFTANYLALKERGNGRLEEKMEKKRKQNAQKDRRFMPRQDE